MTDLKVLVDKNSFNEIQDCFLSQRIKWEDSRVMRRNYDDNIVCLYFRRKSKTIQYGIYKCNFYTDKAKEVSVKEFISELKKA